MIVALRIQRVESIKRLWKQIYLDIVFIRVFRVGRFLKTTTKACY